MNNKRLFFVSIVILGFSLAMGNCNSSSKPNQPMEPTKTSEDLEKEKVLKLAEQIAFKEYGNIIKNELPLKAKLMGDSIWVIEGTLPEGSLGGTVYIELSKSDHKLLKILHYK